MGRPELLKAHLNNPGDRPNVDANGEEHRDKYLTSTVDYGSSKRHTNRIPGPSRVFNYLSLVTEKNMSHNSNRGKQLSRF